MREQLEAAYQPLPRWGKLAIAADILRSRNRDIFARLVDRITTIKHLAVAYAEKADEEFVMLQPRLSQFIPKTPEIKEIVGQLKIYADNYTVSDFLQDWKLVAELICAKWGSTH